MNADERNGIVWNGMEWNGEIKCELPTNMLVCISVGARSLIGNDEVEMATIRHARHHRLNRE